MIGEVPLAVVAYPPAVGVAVSLYVPDHSKVLAPVSFVPSL
jgi:hypothetical protein